MLIEQQIKHYRALDKWFQSPLGLFAAHEFSVTLESINESLRGDTLLQLGNCGDNPWLRQLKYKHQWIASPFAIPKHIQLECAFNHIPLDRNSVDCVVAPLTMEPFNNSISLIDEIDRILSPMGFVILLSINPWSLWGGAIKTGLLNCYHDHHVTMRTPFSLNRIFIQRGYSQYALSNFCYIPPVNNTSLIKKLTFLDEIGKMLWPYPSGFYCYIAQKHQLIQPTLLERARVQPLKEYPSPLQPVTLTPAKSLKQ